MSKENVLEKNLLFDIQNLIENSSLQHNTLELCLHKADEAAKFEKNENDTLKHFFSCTGLYMQLYRELVDQHKK